MDFAFQSHSRQENRQPLWQFCNMFAMKRALRKAIQQRLATLPRAEVEKQCVFPI